MHEAFLRLCFQITDDSSFRGQNAEGTVLGACDVIRKGSMTGPSLTSVRALFELATSCVRAHIIKALFKAR